MSDVEDRGAGEHPVRIAILDDHEVLLDSMTTWVAQNAPDFRLVLAAQTWLQLVHSDQFPADIVIIDFQLKEQVSIEARVRTCRAAGAKVVVLSSLTTEDAKARALGAGAAAFLSKSLSMHEVMDAVRGVMGMKCGEAPAQEWRPLPRGVREPSRPKLSPGEEEALRLYVSGLSTAEVGERMDVKYETAKTYLRRVREKYAKANRPAGKKAELIRRAAEDGYLQ